MRFWVIGGILSVSCSLSQGLEIPLTISEPAGVDRVAEPVTSGVPISTNMQTGPWALFDGAQEIPLQTTLLPGAHTPWLLLDFQMSVGGLATRTLTLKQQAPTVLPQQALTFSEDASQITVITGPLKLQISKTDFNLLDSVWLDRNNDTAFNDATERILSPISASNLQIINADTLQVFSGRGVPNKIEWEYQGSLRATLRVDGTFRNGPTTFIDYTARITFFAGSSFVKIDYVLRNSLQTQERYVKAKSAPLVFGPGTTTLRASSSGSQDYFNLSAATGLAYEAIPSVAEVLLDYNTQNITNMNVDSNGGLILGDMSYHGATLDLDFGEGLTSTQKTQRAASLKSPLFALASPDWYSQNNAFGAERFGTYDDEKNSYRKWGWTWPVPGNPMSYEHETYATHLPDFNPRWSRVHLSRDGEADELWQDLLMYARTGLRMYLDRAKGWARYEKWEWARRSDGFEYAWDSIFEWPLYYRTPVLLPANLTSLDQSFIDNNVKANKTDWNHIWAGGLVDYYYMTGDKDALEAAVDFAEIAKRIYSWRIPGQHNSRMEGSRMPARQFMDVIRVWEATQDSGWYTLMEHMAQLYIQSIDWDPRGFYYSDYSVYPGAKIITPFMLAIATQVLYHYYILSGNATIRERLLAYARFIQNNGIDPAVDFTGDEIMVDYPSAGDVTHMSFATFRAGGQPPDPVPYGLYTSSFVDTLTIGYRLTGDRAFLTRAKYHWDRGTKGGYDGPPLAGPNQVGSFASSLWGYPDSWLFPGAGDETETALFFKDAAEEDLVMPSIAITSPVDGATVSGTVIIQGTASDNVAVSRVEVQVDGGAAQTVSGTSSWNLTLNTFNLSNGSHSILARAVDSSGNSGTQSVTVSVNNQTDTTPPSVSITSPLDGAATAGPTLGVTIAGSDNVAVQRVELLADGVMVNSQSFSPGQPAFSANLNWKALSYGPHTLQARAVDVSGNMGLSSVVNITVVRGKKKGFVILKIFNSQNPEGVITASDLQDGTPRALMVSPRAGYDQMLVFSDEVGEAKVMSLSGKVVLEGQKSGSGPVVIPLQGGGGLLESGFYYVTTNQGKGTGMIVAK